MLIPSSLLLPSSGLTLIGRADICFFRGTLVTSSRPKSILIKSGATRKISQTLNSLGF